jgi:hypothetical protein
MGHLQRTVLGLRINRRLIGTVSLVSLVVMTAGALAMHVQQGVFIASVLLTVAFLILVIGVTYANDRMLGMGIATLFAAALPLFLILQEIGLSILRSMGSEVAGGLLVAVGGLLACGALWMWLARNSLRTTLSR